MLEYPTAVSGTHNCNAGVSNGIVGISNGSAGTSNGSVGLSNGSAGISDGNTGTSQALACFYHVYLLHAPGIKDLVKKSHV